MGLRVFDKMSTVTSDAKDSESFSRAVILNGCAARFARRAAKLSRRCHTEKIIKTVSFNINFEKGTREKCSRALPNLFSR
jgi:hypothetical protein